MLITLKDALYHHEHWYHPDVFIFSLSASLLCVHMLLFYISIQTHHSTEWVCCHMPSYLQESLAPAERKRDGSHHMVRSVNCDVLQLETNAYPLEGFYMQPFQCRAIMSWLCCFRPLYTLLPQTALKLLYADPESFILVGLLVAAVFVPCLLFPVGLQTQSVSTAVG